MAVEQPPFLPQTQTEALGGNGRSDTQPAQARQPEEQLVFDAKTPPLTYLEQDKLRLIRQKYTPNNLKKGGAYNDPETGQLIITDKQWLNIHREMMREKNAEQKVANRLKNAQPGDPRFESFIHFTALRNSDRYHGKSANVYNYDTVHEIIQNLRGQDEDYRREYDGTKRASLAYWYALSHRSTPTKTTYWLFAQGLRRIRDQKIAEIRKSRRQSQPIQEELTPESDTQAADAQTEKPRRSVSPDTRRRISDALKGKPLSAKQLEHLDKLHASFKGKKRKPFSPEHRANMSRGQLKRWIPKQRLENVEEVILNPNPPQQ